MASDQYYIPGSEHQNPLAEALTIADSLRYTPENQPEAFQYIKDIESRIHSYRETAVAAEAKKSPWLKAMRPFVLVPKSPYEKLVEKEGILGGQLFQKTGNTVSQRFWYHDNNDWFYESIDGQKSTTVIRIQTTPSSLHKIVNGIEVPFAVGEQQHFAELPIHYEKKVLPLYPIDAMLQDNSDELAQAA